MTTAVTKPGQQEQVPQVRTLDDLPLQRAIASMEDKFGDALPAYIPRQRFTRTAINAVLKPEIDKVANTAGGRQSIYESCLKAAADGLLLDGREAALVAFNVNVGTYKDQKWEARAQYMPMVAGLLKKARNSGEIDAIYCNVVYRNDTFKLSLVAEGCPVLHEPSLEERGEMVGVYALARLKDGSWTQPEWMTKGQVDAIRERSRSGATRGPDGKERKPSGPWVTDYDEMARKTVLKRASKYWPSSTDKDGVDPMDTVRQTDDDFDTIELTPNPAATPPAPRKARGAAKAALTAPEPAAPPQDDAGDPGPAEGEVIDANPGDYTDI